MASEHTLTGATVVAEDPAARPVRGLKIFELVHRELTAVEQAEQVTIARVTRRTPGERTARVAVLKSGG